MTGQVAELREQLELARRQDPNPNPSKRGDPNPSIAVFSNTDPLTLHEGVSQDREWVGFEEEGRHAGGGGPAGEPGARGGGGGGEGGSSGGCGGGRVGDEVVAAAAGGGAAFAAVIHYDLVRPGRLGGILDG
jgi:hypothetical protein